MVQKTSSPPVYQPYVEEEVDLRVYINMVLRRWRLIIAAILLAALGAGLASMARNISRVPQYETAALVVTDQVGLATSDSLLQQVQSSSAPNLAVAQLRQMVSASNIDHTPPLVELKVQSPDPQQAAQIANSWADLFVVAINDLNPPVISNNDEQVLALTQEFQQAEANVELAEDNVEVAEDNVEVAEDSVEDANENIEEAKANLERENSDVEEVKTKIEQTTRDIKQTTANIERVKANIEPAKEALVVFEGRNQIPILQAQSEYLIDTYSNSLIQSQQLTQIIQDIEGFRAELVTLPSDAPVAIESQLTYISFKLKVFDAKESTGLLQISDPDLLSGQTAGEIVTLLDQLVTTLQEKSKLINAPLAQLEADILELQGRIQALEIERYDLNQNIETAQNAPMVLETEVEELEQVLQALQESQEVQESEALEASKALQEALKAPPKTLKASRRASEALQEASEALQEASEALQEALVELEQASEAQGVLTGQSEVTSQATVPQNPIPVASSTLSILRNIALAAVVGLMIGLGLAFLIEYLGPKPAESKQVT